MTTLGPVDTEHFRDLVARRLGLQFDESRLGFLAEVLRRRLAASKRCADDYLRELASARSECVALAQELTVSETYFFRNGDQFQAFREVAIPERMQAQSERCLLRLLSAGCASGEEAYSMALVVREQVTASLPWSVELRAVDVNTSMLARARAGRYSAWSLRETPSEVQKRWLPSIGREYVLDDEIRTMVAFQETNLAEDDSSLWQSDYFDVVFCRNVIMYFSPDQAQALIARIARSLAPGGYLFLGHAETLRGVSQEFHLRHTHGTFYYQRRGALETPRRYAPAPAASTARLRDVLPAAVESSGRWVDAIRSATERVQALSRSRAVASGAPWFRESNVMTSRAVAARNIAQAVDLLRGERYADALALVTALPSEIVQDPEVLLLRAVLLLHSGALVEAENACLELLSKDELNAGAYYLLALSRESGGDSSGSREHHSVAVYLDPDFAMPRLHLGLLARRAGDHETARRELGRAIPLLQREDASRLLLFGGGFSREALVALGRAELVACGADR